MDSPAMLLNRAQDLHGTGRLGEAMALYRRVLAAEPRNYGANYLMGIALYQSGETRRAVQFLEEAAALRPSAIEAHKDLGLILLNLGEHGSAEASLARALRIEPRNPQLLVNRGIALKNLGRHAEAAVSHRAALAASPGFAEAHYHLGNALLANGQPEEALAAFRRAAELKPGLVAALQGAGQALIDLGRPEEAIATLEEAARLNPGAADTQRALGVALLGVERTDEAMAALDRALAIDPALASALAAKGAVLERLGQLEEALASYTAASAAEPANADAAVGAAIVLRRLDRLPESIAACDRAIALAPQRPEGYYAAALAFMRQREFDPAVRSLDAALKYAPDNATYHFRRAEALWQIGLGDKAIEAADNAIAREPTTVGPYMLKAEILSQQQEPEQALAVLDAVRAIETEKDSGLMLRFFEKMQMCRWEDFDENIDSLRRYIAAGNDDAFPFQALTVLEDPALQRACAEANAAALHSNSLSGTRRPMALRDGRITIAYVSGDFRRHATMHLMAELFELHDRSRFRLVAFSLKEDANSTMRQRVTPMFDSFHDLDDLSDREVIELGAREQVDIAVDLMGYTRYSRPSLFAAGLAPIQVSYLGYPGTTGIAGMDYIIADPVLIPPDLRQHYSEKIAYLPDCYQPNDRKRKIAEKTFTRAELGLPDEAFVFCCFNNNFKVTPRVFDSWMRILHGAPGAVLWLMARNAAVEKNLRAAAAARGIDGNRLVFAPPMLVTEHLARHSAADLFLDTLPYNAHTTGSDALWTGLPMLTLPGETFASRVGASLLTAVGMPELIATSRAQYERMAVSFYEDRPALDALRARLVRDRNASSLFDTARYARNLEALFTRMVERHRAGLAPDHLEPLGATQAALV